VNDRAESAATRLWQDRVQLREQERNEAQRQARIAQEKVAALTAENDRLATEVAHLAGQNDRLATEVARLRALLAPDPASDRAQTEREMEALKDALLSLLDKQTEAQQ
jgi:regulator of replication initiation timing